MDMRAVREAIGKRMEVAARAHGWGASETAEALGEAVTTVRQWWSGSRLPPAEKMDRYAALFGQAAGFFYGEHLAAAISEADLGVSPALWQRLTAADRMTIRGQVLTWATLRDLAREPPRAPSTDE